MRMCAQGIDNVGASAQDKRMNTTTATTPVIISQPAYGKGGRTRIGTRRLGHLATDVTDGRTLCGIRMDAPDLENVRVMPFERSVECPACKLSAQRVSTGRW